jgi:hypothetical protein
VRHKDRRRRVNNTERVVDDKAPAANRHSRLSLREQP